jgi:DNA-binding CsgD family transcriptional regulator
MIQEGEEQVAARRRDVPVRTPAARAPALTVERDGDGPLGGETVSLARRLLRRASFEAPVALGDADEVVLLDLEADGVRLVLIAKADVRDVHALLSPREQEIVRMVSRGYPNKTIAAVLDISTWTVATHLRRIFAKLGVRTRAAMVARAIELGLVPPLGGGAPVREPLARAGQPPLP